MKMAVSPELHAAVLKRDGACFLYTLDKRHRCQDTFNRVHAADDLSKLTVDHVNMEPGGIRGKRAPDDEQHMVAMCGAGNIMSLPRHDPFNSGLTRKVREAEREYLKGLYA